MRPQVTFAEWHVIVMLFETTVLHFYQVCGIAGHSVYTVYFTCTMEAVKGLCKHPSQSLVL